MTKLDCMTAYIAAAKRRNALMGKRFYVLRTKIAANRELPVNSPVRAQLESRYLSYVSAFAAADTTCRILSDAAKVAAW